MKLTSSPGADVLKQHDAGSVRKSILLITAVSLGTSALLAAVLWAYNPEYLRNASACRVPDSGVYLSLGRNLIQHGQFSRSAGPPYLPEHAVPPVYPVVVGLLELLGDAPAIYIAQAILRAGTCVLVYLLVRATIGHVAGLWAGTFMALDLYHLVYSFIPMSETLFLFLLAAGLLLSLPVLVNATASTTGSLARLLVGGCLLGLAILTRPAGLYAPLALLAMCGIIWWRKGALRRMWSSAAVTLAGTYCVVGVWVLRNCLVFSLPVVGVAGDAFPVYLTAASAYMVKHDVSLEEAQAMLAEEFDLPAERQVAEPRLFNRSPADITEDVRAFRRVKWKALTKYPGELVYSCTLGMAKATVGHPLGDFAKMTGKPWINPGTKALIFSPLEAWRRAAQNPLAPFMMFIFHMGFTPVFLVLTVGGIVGMLRNTQRRSLALVLLAGAAYFYLTVAMGGCSVEDRYRLPAFVFLCCFAGWAASRTVDFYRNWRSRAQPA